MNAPSMSPYAADLEGLCHQLGRNDAGDHPEDEKRIAVERQPGGFTTRRR